MFGVSKCRFEVVGDTHFANPPVAIHLYRNLAGGAEQRDQARAAPRK
jgi:hypothetical protein